MSRLTTPALTLPNDDPANDPYDPEIKLPAVVEHASQKQLLILLSFSPSANHCKRS